MRGPSRPDDPPPTFNDEETGPIPELDPEGLLKNKGGLSDKFATIAAFFLFGIVGAIVFSLAVWLVVSIWRDIL